MSTISRPVLLGALILILLSSGCGVLTRGAPTPVWTVPPQGTAQMPIPTFPAPVTPTGTAVTAVIPITGENVVSLQCQFCVDTEMHAILVFPDSAYFDVSEDSGVSCLTADVVNGRRILICRGPQSTSFNLNICSDTSNCLQFPVTLQACPLLQGSVTPGATTAPIILTPARTLKAPTKKATPTPPDATATAGPGLTSTPVPGSATATMVHVTPTSPAASTPTTSPSLPPATTAPSPIPRPTATPASQATVASTEPPGNPTPTGNGSAP